MLIIIMTHTLLRIKIILIIIMIVPIIIMTHRLLMTLPSVLVGT